MPVRLMCVSPYHKKAFAMPIFAICRHFLSAVHVICRLPRFPGFFTALCFSNGAVMPSLDVRLSVTLMDADHIR